MFEADATGLYKSFDGKKIVINNTGTSRLHVFYLTFYNSNYKTLGLK